MWNCTPILLIVQLLKPYNMSNWIAIPLSFKVFPFSKLTIKRWIKIVDTFVAFTKFAWNWPRTLVVLIMNVTLVQNTFFCICITVETDLFSACSPSIFRRRIWIKILTKCYCKCLSKLVSKSVFSVIIFCFAQTKRLSKHFGNEYLRIILKSNFFHVTVFRVNYIRSSVKICSKTKSFDMQDTNLNWRLLKNLETKLNVPSHPKLCESMT